MDVQLTIVWQIIIHNERNLRNIQTTRPDIGGNEDTAKRMKKLAKTTKRINYLSPARNCFMISSRSFCSMSACIAATVKFASRNFSASQST
jgi:hypothetical protein